MSAQNSLDHVANQVTPARHPEGLRYTVIAPVYRVEKYLDTFFGSIVGQTIGFEDWIQLIVVDDGSDDGSTEICRSWSARYPGNIVYVRRENGGAFSAVMDGLQLARGEWVAMFGADDFIDPTYFAAVESALALRVDDEPSIVVCRQIFFFERDARHSDTHPLRGWFEGGLRLARLDEGPRPEFQLSAASALFRRDEALKLRDVEDIRPNFEDANFIARYLLNQRSPTLLIVPDAVYRYRKRADSSSLLDAAPTDPRRYSELLEKGYLRLLVDARRLRGEVPLWMQRLVLYDLSWQFGVLVDTPEALLPIPNGMRDRYHALLERIFAHIESSTIVAFELPSLSMLVRLGILERYRRVSAVPPRAEVTGLDRGRGLAGISVLHAGPLATPVRFRNAGEELIPTHVKTIRHQFVGQPFAHETIHWLPWAGEVTISAGGPSGPMLIRDIGSSHVGASLRLPHPAAFYQSQPVSATPGVPPE